MDDKDIITAVLSAYRDARCYQDHGIFKWSGGGFSDQFSFKTLFRRPSLYRFCRRGTWVGRRSDLPAEPTHVVLGQDSEHAFVANFAAGKVFINEYASLSDAFRDEAPYSSKVPYVIATLLFEDGALGDPLLNRPWQIAARDIPDHHVLERYDHDLGLYEAITIASNSMLISKLLRRTTRKDGSVSLNETHYRASVGVDSAAHTTHR